MRVHFRRIYRSGVNYIPSSGPVIFACNHPNAFLDAIVVALSVDRPVHFLTRSDVFKTRLARFFLVRLNMIPIYRMRDGMDSLDKNQAVFQRCIDILQEGKVLLIFSEGSCVMEKRLRPLKKGTARIAFLAEKASNWKLNVNIIPVGINYIEPQLFRTDLIISFGRPFQIPEFNVKIQEDLPKAINEFNRILEQRLADNMWIIGKSRNENEAEFQLQTLSGSHNLTLFSQVMEADSILHRGKLLLLEENFHVEMKSKFLALRRKSISTKFSSSEANLFLIILGLFPALVFAFLLLPPWLLAYLITARKVRVKKFRSSVMFGLMFILTCFGGFLSIVYAFLFWKPLYALALCFLWPIAAWFLPVWLNACEAFYYSTKLTRFEKKHSVSFSTTRMD